MICREHEGPTKDGCHHHITSDSDHSRERSTQDICNDTLQARPLYLRTVLRDKTTCIYLSSPREGRRSEGTNRQRDGRTERPTERPTERETDRQTDRQTERQTTQRQLNITRSSCALFFFFSSFFFFLFLSFFFFFLCAKGDSSVVVARDVVPDNLVRDGESSELVRLCPFLPLSGVMTCVFLQKSGCDAVDNNGVCLLCDVFGDRYRHTKGREGGKGGLTVACCVLT